MNHRLQLEPKESVIHLGLAIRQMQLPGFRKRKHTLKEKPRPLGTSHFLLLGLLENPDLPIPRPSLFPAQHAAGWGGVQEATGC